MQKINLFFDHLNTLKLKGFDLSVEMDLMFMTCLAGSAVLFIFSHFIVRICLFVIWIFFSFFYAMLVLRSLCILALPTDIGLNF